MGFRLMLASFPKGGKTGSLPALANAGYTIRYINADNNTEPLFAFVKPEAKKRIQVVDCIDKLSIQGDGSLKVGGAQNLRSWTNMVKAMDKWPVDGTDPQKWGDRDVLVIDTLTEIAKGYARRLQVLNNREGKKLTWDDFSQTQSAIDSLMVLLKGYLNCHVVVCVHLQLIGPDFSTGDVEDDSLKEQIITEKLKGADIVPWKLQPISLGKSQAKTLAAHFGGCAYIKDTGGRGRKIFTQPEDGFDAGIPIPGIARELPIETGLATIFDGVSKLKSK